LYVATEQRNLIRKIRVSITFKHHRASEFDKEISVPMFPQNGAVTCLSLGSLTLQFSSSAPVLRLARGSSGVAIAQPSVLYRNSIAPKDSISDEFH
jgi:hypothetical protein